ncbi:hypothetical protein GEV33_004283 [Tenebrio molitor]|uniref:Sulfotransferase domain-containing protein n=1 Tax=Tenebrio molitor TaxID=7067 RepID=A0A8J6HRV9_TENMO|nr:hypothetical protein GEV33_004283 [Tenebrio molitor]
MQASVMVKGLCDVKSTPLRVVLLSSIYRLTSVRTTQPLTLPPGHEPAETNWTVYKSTYTFSVNVVPFDCFIPPSKYEELKEQIKNLEISERDVWICSFPRSGSTWTREMVWMIVNDCDSKGAQIPIDERCLFLEENILVIAQKPMASFKEVMRHNPNVLFLRYEEMKSDLGGVTRRVSQFLQKTLTDEQIEVLVHHLDFESLKNNPAVNYTPEHERLGKLRPKSKIIRKGTEDRNYKKTTLQIYNSSRINPIENIQNRKDLKNPLVFKTHLPFTLLPKQISSGEKKPKIIYVARDVKDTCVSYYHYGKFVWDYRTDFNEYCDAFLRGKAPYSPYWNHVLSYWQLRHNPNVLFLRYEEMKSDLGGVIRRVSQFLQKNLTDEQIKILTHHLDFESMKKNPAVNYEAFYESLRKLRPEGRFIRKGIVGDHKTIMSLDMQKKFDDWIESSIQDTDYSV